MRTNVKKPIAVLLSALMLLTAVSVGFVFPAFAEETITGNADAYQLTFNANGGEGADVTQATYNRQTQPLEANAFTRTGYRFTGWNTEADGSGVAYADGATVTNPAVSYRAQYLRVYTAGNTSNGDNHLVELQAIDTQGRNVAQGKTGNVGTDGAANNVDAWVSYSNYYQVDFGAQYDIKTVNLWRYWYDGRQYLNTVVVLSENGTFGENDRLILFNADNTNRFGFGNGLDMRYPESKSGISMSVSDVRRANTYEARYLRVYFAGSTANNYNHLAEITAYDVQGKNVALGKSGNLVTDGSVASSPYIDVGEGAVHYQIDFGAAYDITSIGLWRYWSDGRTYYDTVVVLSKNGTFAEGDRLVVFNADDINRFGFGCGADKDYPETAKGKAFYVGNAARTLPTFDARFVRVYQNGNTANSANHLVELQVMANGSNVAYGKSGNAITDGVIDTNGWVGFDGNYYQIDFGAVYPVNSVRYWNYWQDARYYHNLVVVLSKNGTFAGDDLCVLWNADKTNMFGFGAGTDPTFTETSAGKTFWVPESPAGLTAFAKARYVRVYNGGSYANDASGYAYQSHISEIQVFAGDSVNVAYGKSGNVATDGDRTDVYPHYYNYGWGNNYPNNYFELDLGSVYDVTGVKLWQYYADNRTYHNNVIVLSENGTFAGNDYTVIFNTDYCNMHGFGKGYDNEYVESMAGRLFPVKNVYAASAGNKTLYAQWVPNAYTISFDDNSGGTATGSTVPISATYDVDYPLTDNGFSRFGYTFAGWAESADGDVVYSDGETVRNLTAEHNGSVTLFAKWDADPYTMTLDVNGGDAIAPIDYTVESTDAIPQPNRDGYDFVKWTATAAEKSWTVGETYAVGTPLGGKIGNVTLQASWSVRYDTPYTVNHYYMNADGSYPATPVSQTLMGETDTTAEAAGLIMETAHYTLDAAASDASITILGDGSAALNLYYKRNTNTVLFKNAAGETVQTDTLYYGAVPAYTGATPALAATGENTYTFLGWTANASAEPGSDAAYYAANNLPPVTADVTYYPYFGTETNSYDITFTVDGADTVLSFPYGATPAFNGIPEKSADAHATYTFSGWSPALAPVTEDAAYTAQFSETVKSYPVFVNACEGSEVSISSQMAAHDTVLDFTVTVKEGYDPTSLRVTANGADISALGEDQGNGVTAYSIRVLTDTVIEVADLTKYTYEITFVAGDETVTKTFAYGETPVYGKTPAKAATAQYTYTFTGWSPEIVPAAANATYTAQFSETLRSYPVYVNGGVGSTISIASGERDYGTVLDFTVTVNDGYTDAAPVVTVGDTVLTETEKNGAVFSYSVTVTGSTEISVSDLAKNTYTVKFIVEGVETEKTVAHGETPDYGSVPTKAADDVNFYAFSGWSPAIVPATADATYTAQFEATPIPAHEHEFDTLVRTVAATCVSAGYDEYICDCGMTEQRNATAINAENHAKDPILVGKRDATETEDGYSGDLICPACGETITEGHVEPKTAVPHEHDFATLVSHADATCAAKAYDIYACECGETQKIETGEVNPDNHAAAPMTVGQRDATTEEYGYTGDVICPACDKVLSVGEVIEKTVVPHVHSFTTVIEEGAATCVAKAYTVKQCACGETERTETGEVNPENHAGSIILVGAREATATMGGYSGDKICTACGETVETGTFTDPTDPGHTHDYSEIVETGEATCVSKAYTIYQCACGDTKKVETGSLNPDNHAGEIKTLGAREATATVDGYTGDKYCLACGKLVEEGSVIPHTGSDTPDTPTNPDTPTTPDDSGSNSDTRISFLDWLRNLIRKILALFKIGGGDNSPC